MSNDKTIWIDENAGEANLELRKTIALEKIAHWLEEISENGLLFIDCDKPYDSGHRSSNLKRSTGRTEGC